MIFYDFHSMTTMVLPLLLWFGPWESYVAVPKAPEAWVEYYTCDFVSPETGLRIVIYYQGMPCGPTKDWIGYRQQFSGIWKKSTSIEWGNLDPSLFSCCNPA